MYNESGCAQQSDCNNNSGCAHQSDHFDNDNNYNPPPLTLLSLWPLPGGPRIWDWNRNGPEGLEYKGYESEGLKYGRYKLEGFEHPGYKPRRAKFEGTTGRDIENVKNESQRLGFEPDRETQGMPILWLHPPPTPAASHLNPSATLIPHYLPSPRPTNWKFHLPNLDAHRSLNAEGLQPFQKTLLFHAMASSKFHKFKKIFSLLIYPTSQVYILITIIYNAF